MDTIKPDRNRWKSIADYAKLCDRTPRTIYARIEAGTLPVLKFVLPDESEQLFIDVQANPPVREIPVGRKPGAKS